MKAYTFVVPAYNEARAIGTVLADLVALSKHAKHEIIVVDDCSTDGTAEVVTQYPVTLMSNVQNFGYGYSLKRGIAAASHPHIVILDADGSYPVAELPRLIDVYEKGFDMVVGARQGMHYRGSWIKQASRVLFRLLAEFATGRTIPDINSGCRVFGRDKARTYFHTLSSGFSFTTTITLAFMLNALSVTYLPISYHKRTGSSKVRYLRDTLRSGQIIIEAIVFYNPLKIFLLCAIVVFAAGVCAAVLALWSFAVASLLFWGVAFGGVIFSLGLLAVLIKFVGSRTEVPHA